MPHIYLQHQLLAVSCATTIALLGFLLQTERLPQLDGNTAGCRHSFHIIVIACGYAHSASVINTGALQQAISLPQSFPAYDA